MSGPLELSAASVVISRDFIKVKVANRTEWPKENDSGSLPPTGGDPSAWPTVLVA